jgi:uridylate kinase
MKKEVIVLSLGGSVIVPDGIDVKFLKNLKNLIKNNFKKYKFIIVAGGGKTARRYQGAAKKFPNINDKELDWIGIHATWMNADLVRRILSDIAYKCFLNNPNRKVKFDKVLIAGGWKPGRSTDYDAVLLAKNYKAKTVINMTNINYLHDKNPEKYKKTKIIKHIDWKGFRKIVGNKWKPGMNVPFDPIAAKQAQKLKLKLVLIGNNLKNFDNLLKGRKFKGSIVG